MNHERLKVPAGKTMNSKFNRAEKFSTNIQKGIRMKIKYL